MVLFWVLWLRVRHPTFMSVSAMLVNAIAVIVAFVPEGLPLALSMGLNIIARRLCRAYFVLVKRLGTIETVGSMSLLASDKTGTLTQNKMSITGALCASGSSHSTLDFPSMVAAYNSRHNIRQSQSGEGYHDSGGRYASGVCNGSDGKGGLQIDLMEGKEGGEEFEDLEPGLSTVKDFVHRLETFQGRLRAESESSMGYRERAASDKNIRDSKIREQMGSINAGDKEKTNGTDAETTKQDDRGKGLDWVEAVLVISALCNQAKIERKMISTVPETTIVGHDKVVNEGEIEVSGSNSTDRVMLRWAYDILSTASAPYEALDTDFADKGSPGEKRTRFTKKETIKCQAIFHLKSYS